MQELDTATQLTPQQASLVQSLLGACVREVQERVSQGENGDKVVAEVMKQIAQSKTISFSDRLYASWYQKLLAAPAKVVTPVPLRSPSVVLGRDKNTGRDITISIEDRPGGMHVLGRTGAGKSTLLNGISLADIYNGHGGLLVDVDGD